MKKSFITTGPVEILDHKLCHTLSPDSFMIFTPKIVIQVLYVN